MPAQGSKTPTFLVALMGLVLSLLLVLWLGGGTDPIDGLGWILTTAVFAGGPAAVYLLAALGFGSLLGRFLVPEIENGFARSAVDGGLGLGFMLTLSHLLGVLGLLTPIVGIAVCAIGVAAFVRSMLNSQSSICQPSIAWVSIPAVAVLITAASCAPGRLWDSEFGGFDALSYHLPEVQAWIAAGRIEPLQNNVYSFLPSYVESAFLHLTMLTDAPGPNQAGAGWGLIAGDGWRVLSTQWLHAGITIYAAFIVAATTGLLGERSGLDAGQRKVASGIAGGLTLATPWVVVVGSLAYNEMAVIALGAAALAAAVTRDLGAWKRGLIVGGLVGIACGAKPTALFMLSPAVGIVMLAFVPRKGWPAMVLGGIIAGSLMLAPWMIRNAIHAGNPVFPYASGAFGTAHWSAEQAERFADAHRYYGSPLSRLQTALWVSPEAPPNARSVIRWRGITNPQWGLMFYAAFVAIAAGLVRPRDKRIERGCPRRVVLLLVAGLGLQLLAWLTLTHIQSRFLLPCLVLAAPLIGVVVARIGRVRTASIVGIALVAFQMVLTVLIWSAQAGGFPTAGMIGGVRFWKGEPFTVDEQQDFPVASTNVIANGRTVYLLGGSTPLYFRTPVVYHTTWDRSPLGAAMREHPDEPDQWARTLQDAGVEFVLADFAELDRLTRSDWYDPLISSTRVMEWLDAYGEPVAGWPNAGQLLYRLNTSPELRDEGGQP